MYLCSRQRNHALRGLLFTVFLLGCSDSAGPGAGDNAVRLRYTDGQAAAFTITSDSALYRIYAYPIGVSWGLMATAYVPPTSTAIGVRSLYLSFDSIGQAQVALGSYPVDVAPQVIYLSLSAEDARAAADSGTITITRNDSDYLAGTLDVYFSYFQYVTTQPPPFHLTGAFEFRNIGSTPLPPAYALPNQRMQLPRSR